MTATITKETCPDWCNETAEHLHWDNLLKERGKQGRFHNAHPADGEDDVFIQMEQVLDTATGTITDGPLTLYVSPLDDFNEGVDAATARRYARELLAAADKLDEIMAAQR